MNKALLRCGDREVFRGPVSTRYGSVGLAGASTVKDACTQPGRNASVALRLQF